MSFSTSARSLPQRFVLVLSSFLERSGLAFTDVLPEIVLLHESNRSRLIEE